MMQNSFATNLLPSFEKFYSNEKFISITFWKHRDKIYIYSGGENLEHSNDQNFKKPGRNV